MTTTNPETVNSYPRLVGRVELAKILGCSAAQIGIFARQGILRRYKLGRKFARYDVAEAITMLKAAANSKKAVSRA